MRKKGIPGRERMFMETWHTVEVSYHVLGPEWLYDRAGAEIEVNRAIEGPGFYKQILRHLSLSCRGK